MVETKTELWDVNLEFREKKWVLLHINSLKLSYKKKMNIVHKLFSPYRIQFTIYWYFKFISTFAK